MCVSLCRRNKELQKRKRCLFACSLAIRFVQCITYLIWHVSLLLRWQIRSLVYFFLLPHFLARIRGSSYQKWHGRCKTCALCCECVFAATIFNFPRVNTHSIRGMNVGLIWAFTDEQCAFLLYFWYTLRWKHYIGNSSINEILFALSLSLTIVHPL